MTNRRASRIAAVLASVGALVIIAITIIVWSEVRVLPQAVERAPRIQRPKIAVNASPPALNQQIQPLAAEGPTDIQTSPSPPPTPPPQQTAIYNYLANRFAGSSSANVNVCENLSRVPASNIGDSTSLTRALSNVAQGQTTGDPYVESVLAPVAFIYSQPSVRSLVSQVQTAQATGDPTYMNRPEFRSSLALANSELIANRADLQRIGQHAYHLFVLSRAVALNPNLANAPETMELCERLQSELRPGVQVNMPAEQSDVLRFLAYAGLSPQQVGYDPSISQDLVIQNTNRQVVVKFPWMARILRSEIGTATPVRPAASSQP